MVQDDVEGKGREVDAPGFDQRIEERDAVLGGEVEDVGVEELQHDHPGLFVASVAQLRHHMEPVVILQLLPCHSFDDVEQRLGDQPLQLAERLLFEDGAEVRRLLGGTFPEDEVANLAKQRRRVLRQLLLELPLPLDIGQPRQLSAGQLEEPVHLLVDVGPVGGRRRLAPSQQLGDVRLGHLGGAGELSLLQAELLQSLPDDQGDVHSGSSG